MSEKNPKGWTGRTRGGRFGNWWFVQLIKKFGVGTAYAFVWVVIPYFVIAGGKGRNAIWRMARQRLKRSRWESVKLLLKNYDTLGKVLIDRVAIGIKVKDGIAPQALEDGAVDCGGYRFEAEGMGDFLQLLDRGEGVITLGAHVGNWEVGGVFFGQYGRRMNVVMWDAEYQKIKDIVETGAKNFKVIAVNKDGFPILTIKNALEKGEIVCFQGDRYVGEDRVVVAEVAGGEARLPEGPFAVAAAMRVNVVVHWALRMKKERGYRFIFKPLTIEGNTPQERRKSLAKTYAEALSDVVREAPEQWFNYYDFWA